MLISPVSSPNSSNYSNNLSKIEFKQNNLTMSRDKFSPSFSGYWIFTSKLADLSGAKLFEFAKTIRKNTVQEIKAACDEEGQKLITNLFGFFRDKELAAKNYKSIMSALDQVKKYESDLRESIKQLKKSTNPESAKLLKAKESELAAFEKIEQNGLVDTQANQGGEANCFGLY